MVLFLASPIDIKDTLGETKLFKQLYPDAIEHIAKNDLTRCYMRYLVLATWIQTGLVIGLTADL